MEYPVEVTVGAVGCALIVEHYGIDLDECGCAAVILEPLGGFNLDLDANGYILMAPEVMTGKGAHGDHPNL